MKSNVEFHPKFFDDFQVGYRAGFIPNLQAPEGLTHRYSARCPWPRWIGLDLPFLVGDTILLQWTQSDRRRLPPQTRSMAIHHPLSQQHPRTYGGVSRRRYQLVV